MINNRNLDAKEDYRRVIEEIQGELEGCVGQLVILSGYLDSELALDHENMEYALFAAQDIVRLACKSVKRALSRTYPIK